MTRQILLLSVVLGFLLHKETQAQQTLEGIEAIVGGEIILKSDVDKHLDELHRYEKDELSRRCQVIHELIDQELLYNQALKDSVNVSEDQVNDEINSRINYFVQQIGSESALEDYYGKTIEEIREDMYDAMHKQMHVREVQQLIVGKVKVTPAEIRAYYEKIPEDSLPFYSARVEVAHIFKKPEPTEDAREAARQKALELRSRIMDGENFKNLAILYSDDPGSAMKGGDLGVQSRSTFVPAFSAAAMRLDKDSISQPVESKFGFHIIQLIDRKGEMIHTRHILIKPKISSEARDKARRELDSVRNLIVNDTFTFEQAAFLFSDDEETSSNGGFLFDQQTGDTRIPVDELESGVFFTIDKMEPGEVSDVEKVRSKRDESGYRIVYLKNRTKPHRANLNDDYRDIKEQALAEKKQKALMDWFEKSISENYININEAYRVCEELTPYFKNQSADRQ